MLLYERFLPWNNTVVGTTGNLNAFFMERLPADLGTYIPKSFEVCADRQVTPIQVQSFIMEAREWFVGECLRRKTQASRLIAANYFTESDFSASVTPRGAQPWIIYYSEHGGLGNLSLSSEQVPRDSGIIPCDTMNNHAVAWSRNNRHLYETWLVSARAENGSWDMDSDIGHESAHAAFAPIPLFGQSLERSFENFHLYPEIQRPELKAEHYARICHLLSELAVAGLRKLIHRRRSTSRRPQFRLHQNYQACCASQNHYFQIWDFYTLWICMRLPLKR